MLSYSCVSGPAGYVYVKRDAKNDRNERRNEMNAKSEFASGRSKGVVIPNPAEARIGRTSDRRVLRGDLTGHVQFKLETESVREVLQS